MNKKILVTGATGNIAGFVIPQILDAGAVVHAYVRDANKATHLADLGAILFEGDFSNQEAINHAAKGVDAILAITPAGPEAVTQGEVVLNAALTSGSPYYVRLSAIGAAEDAPTANGRLHHATDQAVIKSGLNYTILRPHYFMQNLFGNIPAMKQDGKLYLGMGEGSLGMIDVRDIADSFVSLLVGTGYKNKIFTPTGPDSLTFKNAAAILSNVLGRDIEYSPTTIEAVGQSIIEAGWGEWGADVMMDYSKAYSDGWGDFTTNDVKEITGKEARSFDQFSREVLAPSM